MQRRRHNAIWFTIFAAATLSPVAGATEDVTFSTLAPGVVTDQYALGATWAIDRQSEVTGAFMYAANNSVTGPSLFVGFGAPPSTTETISMKETLLGIAYTRKF